MSVPRVRKRPKFVLGAIKSGIILKAALLIMLPSLSASTKLPNRFSASPMILAKLRIQNSNSVIGSSKAIVKEPAAFGFSRKRSSVPPVVPAMLPVSVVTAVTTDTGNIAGTTGGTELRFRENPNAAGSFTIAFDEPITEFEFWIRSLANIIGEAENLLGNFVLALSDGSIINNAAFNIIPDLIAPNTNFGLFRTRGTDTSPLSQVTRGGANFVTDPGFDGTPNQAAGRIVFPDIPGVGASPFQDAVGLQSLTFERSGGPTNSGFQTNISASGRVLREEP